MLENHSETYEQDPSITVEPLYNGTYYKMEPTITNTSVKQLPKVHEYH